MLYNTCYGTKTDGKKYTKKTKVYHEVKDDSCFSHKLSTHPFFAVQDVVRRHGQVTRGQDTREQDTFSCAY
jgi:hypothetical protein